MPTTPTTTPSTPVADLDIDLTDPVALDELLASRHARRFSEEHIVEWLRTSGGTLAERIHGEGRGRSHRGSHAGRRLNATT